MVQINFASREVNCKLVYYGPGRCGKTTNLQVVHAKAPQGATGDLISIATETDRTLYFDFLPLPLPPPARGGGKNGPPNARCSHYPLFCACRKRGNFAPSAPISTL